MKKYLKYSFDDLKNGIFCENEGTMLRILKKILAKKRFKKAAIAVIFCVCKYHKFTEEYYAPADGLGYLEAKRHFEQQISKRDLYEAESVPRMDDVK